MREIFGRSGWKAAGKTVCFLLLLALALGWADGVLALKSDQGIYQIQGLYEQERNSIDVLVVGSSHAFYGVDPGTLWDEYGVAAYDLGAGNQTLWSSYFYLKEALRTQRPKVVVLEAYMATLSEEYFGGSWAFLSTSGTRWSPDKPEHIRLSVPPEERAGYLLEWTQYHTRYNALSRTDFLPYHGDPGKYRCWKGSYVELDAGGFLWPEDIRTEERAPLAEKTGEWYRKIMELTRDAGIPLLAVVVPYPGVTLEHQALYNTASDIAAEYGIPFVNYNREFEALGMDAAAVFRDGHHLNIWGSRKFTEKLGALLVERYGLPDRRGDPAWQSWEDYARYIEAYVRDIELSRGISPAVAADLLPDPDYICAVAVSGNGGTTFAPLLEALGVPTGQEGLWLSSGGVVSWASGPEGEEYFQLDYHDLKLSRMPEGNAMVYDKATQTLLPNGVSILVYDIVTQNLAGYFTFDAVAA